MHAPNPMGGYPLVLRDPSVSPRKGELLYDYNTDDLMYSDREIGEVRSVAKDIFDRIIAARLENSRITVCKDQETPGSEKVIPVEDRVMNTWYINIEDRKPIDE